MSCHIAKPESDPELVLDYPISDHGNIAVAALNRQSDDSCKYCGFPTHPRSQCPAKRHKCKICGKMGHWERVCFRGQNQPQQQQSQHQQHLQQQQQQQHVPQPRRQQQRDTSAAVWPTLATIDGDGNESGGFCEISIKNNKVDALLDSGSLTRSFIHKKLAERLDIPVHPCKKDESITMANASFTTKAGGT